MSKITIIFDKVVEVHKEYMEDDNKDYFLVALMSFLTLVITPLSLAMIPFTLYMGLPISTDFIIPVFLSLVPIWAWSKVFLRFVNQERVKQFYPERLI